MNKTPYVFLLPAIIILILISIVPFLFAVNYSFRDYDLSVPGRTGQFIGLENYRLALNNPEFWASLVRTMMILIPSVIVTFFLGLGIAMLLNQKIRGRRLFVSLLLIPMMIAPIAVGMVWKLLLLPNYGLLTQVSNQMGLFTGAAFFSDPTMAPFTIVLMDIWQWTPFIVLIMLAGLSSLPREPLERAKIDGASRWQTLRYVVLPSLLPLIIIALFIRSIEAFKMFDKIWITTHGGPAAFTETATIYTFRQNFVFFKMGYGAATILILFFFVLIICALFFKILQRYTRL